MRYLPSSLAVEQLEQVGPHRRHRLLRSSVDGVARRSSEQTRLSWRHFGSIAGKSSRVCPPRLSSRSSAALATHSLTSSMLRRSSARCQPGLNCRCPSTLTVRGPLAVSSASRASASSHLALAADDADQVVHRLLQLLVQRVRVLAAVGR